MTKKYLKTPEEVIDALQSGKTIHDHSSQWKLHKGFIVRKNANSDTWIVNDYVPSNYDGIYVEEQEPLKLEVGKFYKTRDGRKAWVVSQAQGLRYPYNVAVFGNTGIYNVLENGCFCEDKTSPEDLVAPWEE